MYPWSGSGGCSSISDEKLKEAGYLTLEEHQKKYPPRERKRADLHNLDDEDLGMIEDALRGLNLDDAFYLARRRRLLRAVEVAREEVS